MDKTGSGLHQGLLIVTYHVHGTYPIKITVLDITVYRETVGDIF
jgi:hypothetical protein